MLHSVSRLLCRTMACRTIRSTSVDNNFSLIDHLVFLITVVGLPAPNESREESDMGQEAWVSGKGERQLAA